MTEEEFLREVMLDRVTLEAWIAEAWIAPVETAGAREYAEIDLARARLILDLRQDMGVNDPGVGVILHLVDQLHALRRAMKELLAAGQGAKRPPAAP